jgi:hypothetical protein
VVVHNEICVMSRIPVGKPKPIVSKRTMVKLAHSDNNLANQKQKLNGSGVGAGEDSGEFANFQIDEGISSSQSNNSEYSYNTTSFINMKNKNLKQPGAYIISQRIKNDSNVVKVIDLSDNGLTDEGIMHLAFSIKACNFLTNLVKQFI